MKKLSLLLPILFILTACGDAKEKLDDLIGIPRTMKSMNSTMGEMNGQMGKTTSAIHEQILLISLNGLMDSKNWDVLSPVPFKLMPFGKAFAEETTAEEVINLTYITLKELTESKLDLESDLFTGETKPYKQNSPELKTALQEKSAKFVILSIIAGFTPDSVVNEIISKQAKQRGGIGDGRFQETALAFLTLRAKFLKDVLLDASVLKSPLYNVGLAEEAIKYNAKLDTLSKLKFAQNIHINLVINMNVEDASTKKVAPLKIDFSDKLEINKPLANWNKIKQSMDLDMKVGESSYGDSSQEDADINSNLQQRAASARVTVDSYLSSWNQRR